MFLCVTHRSLLVFKWLWELCEMCLCIVWLRLATYTAAAAGLLPHFVLDCISHSEGRGNCFSITNGVNRLSFYKMCSGGKNTEKSVVKRYNCCHKKMTQVKENLPFEKPSQIKVKMIINWSRNYFKYKLLSISVFRVCKPVGNNF